MSVAAQAEFLSARFDWNQATLRLILENEFTRDLIMRAIRVEAAAKRNASQPPRDGPNSGSEPGRGPAVRTGRLRGSIRWFSPASDSRGPYIDIGSNVFYAPFVESGTSRMAARPYLRPALEAARHV